MAVWLDEVDLRSVWPKTPHERETVRTTGFKMFRGKVASVFAQSEWAEEYAFADGFRSAENIDDFDDVLNEVYDAADIDRVWINTF